MTENEIPKKFGWIHEYPDIRDYTPENKKIAPILEKLKITRTAKPKIPATADLRSWCPPVEDQKDLGSCTANAGVGLIEYFEKRAFGKHSDASRRFLYKTTRNLMHVTGDTGAYLRSNHGRDGALWRAAGRLLALHRQP